jgi:hypothetical protein
MGPESGESAVIASSRPAKTRVIACAAVVAMLSGCFNSSSFTPFITNVAVATGTTSAQVLGQNFSASTVVYGNGRPLPTTFENEQRVTIALVNGETRVAGTAVITAANEGSFVSPPFTVYIFNGPTAFTALSPQQVALGAPPTTLTLTGTGFSPTSQVLWNGSALPTTLVSSTSLTALVPASLLAAAGDGLVQVFEARCVGAIGDCQVTSAARPCTVGRAALKVVQLGAIDLVWDPVHALLFTAVHQRYVSDSITAIDPVSTARGATVAASSAWQLSISDDDQFLYVVFPATHEPLRYTLPGLTGAMTIPNMAGAGTVAVAPGAPTTVALSAYGIIYVVDGTVARTKVGAMYGTQSIAWGFDASTLYAISQLDPGISIFNVDPSGITARSVVGSMRFGSATTISFDRTTRRLYASSGENLDDHGGDPRPFPLAADINTTCKVAIDGVLGKAFFACNEDFARGSGVLMRFLTVRSFDLRTQQQISRILLLANSATPSSVLRWGNDGLAVGTDSAIYLYSGQFVR